MSREKFPLPIDYIYLKVLYAKAAQDPKEYAVLAAFEALFIISGCWRGYGKFKPPSLNNIDFVPVPFWAVDTIAAGWVQYRAQKFAGRSMGEAFGIEGGKQGKRSVQGRHPAKRKWNVWLRNLRLAAELYSLRQDKSYEQAVADVAEKWGVSDSTVKRAWAACGAEIQAAAASFTTSRSGDMEG
jgi:hypothetical protein